MERALVAIVAGLMILGMVAGPAHSMNCYPPPSACAPPPPCTMVTKMVPCMRTEIVAEVQPCTRTVPVQKIGYKTQKVMLKGMPVGSPCGLDPCTKCCPQPFCQVVEQKVPYVYTEPQTVRSYNVVYKPVCRPVMLPQNYLVQAYPMCR